MALRRHEGKVTVFVPHYAMSGGTLLCLAADEVAMDENAVLGPVDPRIGEYPAASILRVPRLKPPEEIEDETFILVDIAAKAQNQMREFVAGLLRDRMDAERADRLSRLLTEGTWTHDYLITLEQARDLGFPVTPGMPAGIYRLMDLFPQAMPRPARRSPTCRSPTGKRRRSDDVGETCFKDPAPGSLCSVRDTCSQSTRISPAVTPWS